jgi:hypothetical protein
MPARFRYSCPSCAGDGSGGPIGPSHWTEREHSSCRSEQTRADTAEAKHEVEPPEYVLRQVLHSPALSTLHVRGISSRDDCKSRRYSLGAVVGAVVSMTAADNSRQ